MAFHGLIFNCSYDIMQRWGGAYRIATFLRSYGWDIEVVEYTTRWSQEEIDYLLKSRINPNTKFVGFATVFSHWNTTFDYIINSVKKSSSDTLIVIGGQGSQRIIASADYFINGYGENAILAILKKHFSNSTEDINLDPAWLSYNKKVVRHESYPSAPMKSLMIKYEDRDFIMPTEWLSVETSRGCIFECKYCNFPILGVKSDYTRDADDFELQLKDTYDRFGVKHYYVADETFNDSTGKLRKFSDAVNKLDFDPTFVGFIRADLLVARKVDRELLAKMGFFGHFYGIETTNHETGKIVGKGMDPDRLLPGLLDIKDYFKSNGRYRGDIGIVVGLPKETEESVRKTANWISNNWQGETVWFWPLEMPNNPMMDKLNQLYLDKEKYGYRESSSPFVKREYYAEINHVASNFNWENDNFNFNSAQTICDQITADLDTKDFRLGSWCLGNYMYEGADLDTVLSYNRNIPWTYDDKKHVNTYISKKLNK